MNAACGICAARGAGLDAIALRCLLSMPDPDEFGSELYGMCEHHLDVLCDALCIPVYQRARALT